MKRATSILSGGILALALSVAGLAAEESVATAVYANVGNGYKREKAKDGTDARGCALCSEFACVVAARQRRCANAGDAVEVCRGHFGR